MFIFQISNYDDPELNMEVARLFQQRLEAKSRRTMPFLWALTDNLNAYAARGSERKARRVRYYIYGILLLGMGIFLFVPGLMEPQSPFLIIMGAFGIIVGLFSFSLARKRKPQRIPQSCQNEAKKLLSDRRSIDWLKAAMEVCFDEVGMTVSSGDKQEIVPYEKMTDVFETENLWLLAYDGGKGLLLQKKDLTSGNTEECSLFLHHRVS